MFHVNLRGCSDPVIKQAIRKRCDSMILIRGVGRRRSIAESRRWTGEDGEGRGMGGWEKTRDG